MAKKQPMQKLEIITGEQTELKIHNYMIINIKITIQKTTQ